MSIPKKITDLDDHLPGKRSPALPRVGPELHEHEGDGTKDPSKEIRDLIEELQLTVREARTQLRAAEEEKDALAVRLAEALSQVEAMRLDERKLRSQFVEVTSLIKERDAAVADAKRLGTTSREVQQQIEALVRSRSELQRQRDDAMRQIEALRRSVEGSATQHAEAQQHVLAVRQARDAAHAQNLELSEKIARAEDRIAEIEYDRDAVQKSAEQSAAELAEYRRQLDAVSAEREETAAHLAQLTDELDTQRRKLLDLSEQKAGALQADEEYAKALAEARAQVASLTIERDNARTRAQEQAQELDDMRQQFEQLRDEQQKLNSGELSSAREKAAAAESQLREARADASALRQELQIATERIALLEQEISAAAPAEKLAALTRDLEISMASHAAAQAQIDQLMGERDAALTIAVSKGCESDEEIVQLRARVMALESIESDARGFASDAKEIAARFERQRVETIDIAAQLQSAQREIRELSASLAEARLQVKFAHATSAPAFADGEKFKQIVRVLHGDSEVQPVVPELRTSGAPPVERTSGESREIKSAIGAMRQCFQSFTKRSEDLSLLNELHCHIHAFSERTMDSGLIAVHRFAAAFGDFTQGLYQNPTQVNPSTLRSLNQTIEFLALLMREKNLAQFSDPASASIYAVDDDPDNCETIRLAMETANMRTDCALDPNQALRDLPRRSCDLIFLDVNLPGMDGFELCTHIRQIDQYARTPIVFLTGLGTLENRVKSSISGGNDFISKPFNVYELPLKALTHILRGQIEGE